MTFLTKCSVLVMISVCLAWAWLAKSKAKVVIPKFQAPSKHLRKTPGKSAKYRIPQVEKNKMTRENKNTCIFRFEHNNLVEA